MNRKKILTLNQVVGVDVTTSARRVPRPLTELNLRLPLLLL